MGTGRPSRLRTSPASKGAGDAPGPPLRFPPRAGASGDDEVLSARSVLKLLDTDRVDEARALLTAHPTLPGTAEDLPGWGPNRVIDAVMRCWLLGADATPYPSQRVMQTTLVASGDQALDDTATAVLHTLLAEDAHLAGHVDRMIAATRRAQESVPAAHVWLRLRIATLLQTSFRFSGSQDLGAEALDAFTELADRTDVPAIAVSARAGMGYVWMLRGEMHTADEYLQSARELALAAGLGGHACMALTNRFLGSIAFEWNHVDRARSFLEESWSVAGPAGIRGIAGGVARILAGVADVQGDPERADLWMDRMNALLHEPATLRTREWVAAARAGLSIRRGDRRDAERWLKAYRYTPDRICLFSDGEVHARLKELSTVGDFLAATGHWVDALRVSARIRAATSGRRRWFAAHAGTVEAAAYEMIGDPDAADERLAEALAEGEEGSLVRAYVVLPKVVLRVIARVRRPATSDDRVRRIESALQAAADGVDPPVLTARERDVMLLLARGLSNKAIARHLGVSIGTVKTHVHKVFAKLGVEARSQVVVRAESFGLL